MKWIIHDEDMIQSIVEQYFIENLINWVTDNEIWTCRSDFTPPFYQLVMAHCKNMGGDE